MFKHILVPTDVSEGAAHALDVAKALAQKDSARLELLHIEPEVSELRQILDDNRAVGVQVDALRREGMDAHYLVEYGAPEKEIPRVAETEHADLIVMAPQRRTWLEGMRHPSVTARTLTRATVPLLIWPEELPAAAMRDFLNTPAAIVLLPLDGSDLAERAIPFAVAFAHRYDVPLVLVRVAVPTPYMGTAYPYTLGGETQWEQELEARGYLCDMRQRLARETQLTVESMLLTGDAGDALLRVANAHHGSLVVMSTHGRSGLSKLVMGSVAGKMIQHSEVPMLVVPQRAAARTPDELATYSGESAVEGEVGASNVEARAERTSSLSAPAQLA
jgi:nucleotide-binding universal stress UspA family protein